ncbi:MAG TPA: PAS domain-containing protein [Flavipsychrobacter sp.]|nr:PAS domain-containing protein [Flavipsychrobacter sp.]
MPKHHFSKQVLEILETIPNSFYVLDKEWNFVYANSEIERLLNKTLDELVGTPFWDVFPKSKFQHLYDQFTKATETNQMVNFEEYSPSL